MKKIEFFLFLITGIVLSTCHNKSDIARPNILFCIADDWGWPHAGVYGDPVVKTPTFDRLSREGVLFQNAFVSSPSCTPSRGAILTGQHFWRLGEGANLWSTLDVSIPVYPLLLEKAGYYVGSWRKSWGPGDLKAGGYDTTQPAGKIYPSGLKTFLNVKPVDAPFCFWLGASDPHREYEKGSGLTAGIDTGKIKLPGFFPDAPEIRMDIADYYYEVQRFDSDVASAMKLLDSLGLLENTIIVMTGDHGMPFPRCKGNLYDMGARVPLAIRWANKIQDTNRVISDFVSLTDLAPTFLSLAGLAVPKQMTGKSLESLLVPGISGQNIPDRSHIVFGRERHTPAQLAPSIAGYPSRAIRNSEYLYIRNFAPDRWPAGVPDGATHPMNAYSDCDNGPTKTYFIEHSSSPEFESFYNWSFGKRPEEELYILKTDPDQLDNRANDPALVSIKNQLSDQMMKSLTTMEDPRALGTEIKFDEYPYRAPYQIK